mmetsp:Transcript_103625/g.297714  ORF Transcript_103625/g.297714 Transcript_103625/m.297714 type:complete len:88 (+) Transcript_103625:527-790(+)
MPVKKFKKKNDHADTHAERQYCRGSESLKEAGWLKNTQLSKIKMHPTSALNEQRAGGRYTTRVVTRALEGLNGEKTMEKTYAMNGDI